MALSFLIVLILDPMGRVCKIFPIPKSIFCLNSRFFVSCSERVRDYSYLMHYSIHSRETVKLFPRLPLAINSRETLSPSSPTRHLIMMHRDLPVTITIFTTSICPLPRTRSSASSCAANEEEALAFHNFD